MEIIKVKNDKGIEKEYEIIFEFDSKNDNKHYIVYTDFQKDKNNIIECFSSIYENNKLYPITTEEELDYINSMIESITEQGQNKYKLKEK